MGHSQGHSERKAYKYKCFYIKISNAISQGFTKQAEAKHKAYKQKEIIKIWAKIN